MPNRANSRISRFRLSRFKTEYMKYKFSKQDPGLYYCDTRWARDSDEQSV